MFTWWPIQLNIISPTTPPFRVLTAATRFAQSPLGAHTYESSPTTQICTAPLMFTWWSIQQVSPPVRDAMMGIPLLTGKELTAVTQQGLSLQGNRHTRVPALYYRSATRAASQCQQCSSRCREPAKMVRCPLKALVHTCWRDAAAGGGEGMLPHNT